MLCLGCMQEYDVKHKVCPDCGYSADDAAQESIFIKPGTMLDNRYIIGTTLGSGGFGTTYLAFDTVLQQKVAIKEYLPSEFSTRMPGQTIVTIMSGEKSIQFGDGLSKFVEEGKKLARFNGESGIVKVFDSFEENSTAYIVMEYLKGETLSDYLERIGVIDEQNAVAMLMPIMESLCAVHKAGVVHRDIAPDNIILTDSGEIKLIDFGAARYATTSYSRSLTVVIKQGYSPEEQYRSRGDIGEHTDVYALSATLYRMITGQVPPDAMKRRAMYEKRRKDILDEPRKINKKLSKISENAILNALNVRIEDRTPTVEEFIKQLTADKPAKRVYGKIKLIDRLRWPLWLKIAVPTLLTAVISFIVLLSTGVIKFSEFSQEIDVPDGVVSVPEVEGMYTQEAIELITAGKLLAVTDGTIESEYIPAGKIILQTPVGGSYLNINSTVRLTVSSGRGVVSPENGTATVPYLIWEPKDEAIEKLIEAGLGEPEIVEMHDDNVSFGAVIAQSVEPGYKVEVGTKITLTVSLGPAGFSMPDVVGKTNEEAQAVLSDNGLVFEIEYRKDDSVAEGLVISQSMNAGETVKRGDLVVLTVSTGKETIELENVVGKPKSDAKKLLEDQGFRITILENYDNNVTEGVVIEQSPNAGASLLKNDEVILYVSKGKQPIKITFNANGGKSDKSSITGYLGETYGSLPTATREGYTFEGWYSQNGSDSKISSATVISMQSSHTLYASWSPCIYSVSFESNGGSAVSSIKVQYDSSYGRLPSPTRTGYAFIGWFTEKNGGKEILSDSLYSTAGDIVLYARWSENAYELSFDANGGNVLTSSKNIVYGTNYGELPVATREGYIFDGWFTSAVGGSKVESTDKVSVTAKQILYAHWTEIVVTAIEVKAPTKTEYYVGQTLNTSGMELTVKYNNFSSETVTSGFTCSPTSFSSAGTKTITVSYGGKTASFTVTVKPDNIKSIDIKSKPSKTTYYVGDSLNTAGLSLNAIYDSGKTQTVTSGFTCSPTSFSSAGTKTVTVSYGGETASFTVTVKPDNIKSIDIKSKPSKTTYYVGDSLNTAGLSLNATYDSGKTQTVTSGFTCSPTSFSSAGTKTVTVSYGGETASFTVTVKPRAYTVSWVDKSDDGYSITVKRTASPIAQASIGSISNGATVYQGDTISVTYTRDDYYKITSSGVTSMKVSGDVTSADIYATAKLNDVSAWVVASSVPSEAQIVETKWTYTLREESTSSSSSKSGWTQFKKERTGWSSTKGPVYSNPSDGVRDVWSEEYEVSRTHYYHYFRYANSSGSSGSDMQIGSWTNYQSVDLTSKLTEKGSNGNYSQGYKWYYNGDGRYRTMWLEYEWDDIQYGTRWYYRDPVYTYHFYRNVSKEATTDPTGKTGVSNVSKMVRYREK